jgi:hypothetical protein
MIPQPVSDEQRQYLLYLVRHHRPESIEQVRREGFMKLSNRFRLARALALLLACACAALAQLHKKHSTLWSEKEA